MSRPQNRETLKEYLEKYRARKDLEQTQGNMGMSKVSLRSKSQSSKKANFHQQIKSLRSYIILNVIQPEVKAHITQRLDHLEKIYQKDMTTESIQEQVLQEISVNPGTQQDPSKKSRLRKKRTRSEKFDINEHNLNTESQIIEYNFVCSHKNEMIEN